MKTTNVRKAQNQNEGLLPQFLGKEVLSFKEALEFLDISSSMLYKLTHQKAIPYYKPNGKLIYFKKEDLLNWVLSNRQDTIGEFEYGTEQYLCLVLEKVD